MHTFSWTRLSDRDLVRDTAALNTTVRTATAELLGHISEIDERKLYLPAGYASMFAYCRSVYGLPEDVAFKRLRAARTARRFPAIFSALAEGRLHYTSVVLLAPHLTSENASELLTSAERKSKSELEQLLALRSPQPDVPTRLKPIGAPVTQAVLVTEQVDLDPVEVKAPIETTSPVQARPVEHPEPKQPPPQRFVLQVTIDQRTRDRLKRAQELMSHQIPSGDVASILYAALGSLIAQQEKSKFAATSKPRASRESSASGKRHIPAHVKRTVRERDGERCTFVSDSGHRCEARRFLEFDHVQEFARGGRATAANLRLRCRAHNQFTAERTYGAGFMAEKREQAEREVRTREPHTRSTGLRHRDTRSPTRAYSAHGSV